MTLRKDKTLFAKMQEDMESQGHWEGEFWNKRKNGEDYAQRLSISAITDETGKLQQYAALIGDITKRKQAEERIRYQANYDSLTELPNRTLFLDRLNLALARMKRGQGKLGLMFIDLDGFKNVNDQNGHLYGSRALVEVAGILRECSRETDVVSRYGGDEFAVLLPDTGVDGAMAVARRVCERIRAHVFLEAAGINYRLTASTGVATLPDTVVTAEELIQASDDAMYQVKTDGKDGIRLATAVSREGISA